MAWNGFRKSLFFWTVDAYKYSSGTEIEFCNNNDEKWEISITKFLVSFLYFYYFFFAVSMWYKYIDCVLVDYILTFKALSNMLYLLLEARRDYVATVTCSIYFIRYKIRCIASDDITRDRQKMYTRQWFNILWVDKNTRIVLLIKHQGDPRVCCAIRAYQWE